MESISPHTTGMHGCFHLPLGCSSPRAFHHPEPGLHEVRAMLRGCPKRMLLTSNHLLLETASQPSTACGEYQEQRAWDCYSSDSTGMVINTCILQVNFSNTQVWCLYKTLSHCPLRQVLNLTNAACGLATFKSIFLSLSLIFFFFSLLKSPLWSAFGELPSNSL